MLYCLLFVFMAAIVAADQIVKALVAANIPIGGTVQAVPGVFHLTQLHNTGAAFSMLEGGRWLFAAICLAGLIVVSVLIAKKVIQDKPEMWCLAAIFGGGIGNMIDRLRFGYVIDMIEVDFMNFAVFNVADIFICCGAAALFIYILFFTHDEKSKKEKTDASDT